MLVEVGRVSCHVFEHLLPVQFFVDLLDLHPVLLVLVCLFVELEDLVLDPL